MDDDRAGPPRPVALVTGASRGIGRAIAERLAADGHAVALVARPSEALERAAAELCRDHGRSAVAIPADLRDPAAAARIVAACSAALGPPSVVVNNAGTAPTARFEDTGDELVDEVLDLHVRAPFRILRAALPALRAHAGVAIQLASTAGLRGFPFTTAYTTAKHAMVGLTRALASELGSRAELRVYAVCPGFVDTAITRRAAAGVAARGRRSADEALAAMAAMNRIGRLHTTDEVAAALAAIVRDRPAGTVLDLDREPPRFLDLDLDSDQAATERSPAPGQRTDERPR